MRQHWLSGGIMKSIINFRRAPLAVIALTVGVFLAASQPVKAGDILLSVDATAVGGKAINFDLAALDALAQQSFRTRTPWTPGPYNFSGPSLKAILDAAGAHYGIVTAAAANNYTVAMPVQDASSAAPVVVTRINGKTFGLRDKGPLWILYPFDADAKYRNEVNDSRSIWQLVTLSVSPK